METPSRKDTFITALFPCQKPETILSAVCYVCAWVHKKSLLRSLMRLKEWNGSLLKQQWINLFPHAVNHTHLRWGPGRGRPAGASSPTASAILLGPPAAKEKDGGASNRDENPSNQTTLVVHFGGQQLEAFWETKKGIYSPPPLPKANDQLL